MINHIDLRAYPNKTFIETGSFLGHGIQAALDAGFEHVISIELAPKYYDLCCQRFAGDPRVRLVLGDSSIMLDRVLPDHPATLWLDGHWSGGDTAMGDTPTPVLQELACVRPCDTILIDDVRCWSAGFDAAYHGGVMLADIQAAIAAIGPYRVSIVRDVLVAVP